jgi:spore coat protein A
MWKLAQHLIACGAACLLLAGAVRADLVDVGASADNTLFSDGFDPGDPNGELSNGAGFYMFAGATKDNGPGSLLVRRALLAFDVAGAIPAGSTVNSVTLTLYMSRSRTQNETVDLHRVLADWGEGTSDAADEEGKGAPATAGDATWGWRIWPTTPWTTPGGDFDPTPSASATVGGQNGFYSWTSTQLAVEVQSWLDTPTSNFGWILIGNEIDSRVVKRFNTSESSDANRRPKLTIDFTPPSLTGACCAADGACSVVLDPGGACTGPSVYQGVGTTCTPNLCPQPLGACCIPDAAATCLEVEEATCAGAFQGDLTTCAATSCPVIPTPFEDFLPLPAVAQPTSGVPGGTATYDITMREVQQQLHSELPDTTVWGYGDASGSSYPGPTIEATTGQPVTVNWINDLRDTAQMTPPLRTSHYLPVDTCPHGAVDDAKTVVHLHGGHVPSAVDGHPEATFLPGNQVTYVYPNNQDAATLWFHDHALGITRLNVYMGLAGFYLIRDPVEAGLGLPSGEFEIPLAIQDRSFNPDGTLKYPVFWQDMFLGETMLANGKVWPRHEVKQGKYRLRLLNGCNSRTLTLQFCSGTNTVPCPSPVPFQLLGQEGGLLPAPVPLTAVTLGNGERADVVVDFAPFAPGSSVYLQNTAPAPFPGTPGVGELYDVMRFDVLPVTGFTNPVPPMLRTMEILNETDAVQFRTLELKKGPPDACSPFAWEVVTTDGLNGVVLGERWVDITEYPELGTTEVWSFINRSGITHPMHMHLVLFQVLDRQAFDEVAGQVVPIGSPIPPPPHESGWKDTVQVGPNEILRVIARFEDYTGRFAYHCHILEHEDHEMMREFEAFTICGDGVLGIPDEECDDDNLIDGDGCSATCQIEDSVTFFGLAEGGQVDLTVDGVLISVGTSFGQITDDIAAAIALAINTDPTLAGLGVTAFASGNTVITVGSIGGILVADTGLTSAFQIKCGDLTGEGNVTSADWDLMRQHLVGTPLAPAAQERCSVIDHPDSCNLLDSVVEARALGGVGPGLSQVCRAFVGP